VVFFGLLPFSVFGWPEKSRDQEIFYPTSLLNYGFGHLFFWVARMIMLGCHFMAEHPNGSVPFRHVYIHRWCATPSARKCRKRRATCSIPSK